MLGLIYPLVMTLVAQLLFPRQANGSLVSVNGKVVGSAIIGQLWTKPQYFHGRPSAAGKGYDPTSTGGTNLGPTSKKLIDATKATIARTQERESGRERCAADRSRHLERQRHRSRHQPRSGLLAGAAGREGARTQALVRQRDRCATRSRANVRLSRRASRQRPRTQPRARRHKARQRFPGVILSGASEERSRRTG